MNYEILVNKENPIDIDYMENIIIPSLTEIKFARDNDDIFEDFNINDTKYIWKMKPQVLGMT